MELKYVKKKPNWFQRLFKTDRPKSILTVGRFLWALYYARKEQTDLHGYVRENINSCDDMVKLPSKKIIKRYNMRDEEINGFVWHILEEYFEGRLIKKEDASKIQS